MIYKHPNGYHVIRKSKDCYYCYKAIGLDKKKYVQKGSHHEGLKDDYVFSNYTKIGQFKDYAKAIQTST